MTSLKLTPLQFSDIELGVSTGNVNHHGAVQFLHNSDSNLSDIKNLSLSEGDLLRYNGSNIVNHPESNYALTTDHNALVDRVSAVENGTSGIIQSATTPLSITDNNLTIDLSNYVTLEGSQTLRYKVYDYPVFQGQVRQVFNSAGNYSSLTYLTIDPNTTNTYVFERNLYQFGISNVKINAVCESTNGIGKYEFQGIYKSINSVCSLVENTDSASTLGFVENDLISIICLNSSYFITINLANDKPQTKIILKIEEILQA